MPSGTTHTKLTKLTALTMIPIGFISSNILFIPLIGGILATLPVFINLPNKKVAIYFNPDMDVLQNRSSTLAKVWGIDAYEQSIRHRSGLRLDHWKELAKKPWLIFGFSHLPGIGTLPRTIMLLLPFAVWLLPFIGLELEPWQVVGQWVFMIWLGMSLSDAVHAAADVIVHFWKEFYGNKDRQDHSTDYRNKDIAYPERGKYAPRPKNRPRRNGR